MTIEARVDLPGLHHWPAAHTARAYLAQPHRHLFRFTLELRVDHDDRAVEWHDLAEWLTRTCTDMADGFHNGLHNYGPRSCESMALHIAAQATAEGWTVTRVSVSEDGEFTAHYRPE